MNILMRDLNKKEWKLVKSVSYEGEVELQELLAESPSLIAIDEIRSGASQLVASVREFGLPGSGHTDIIAFSADGDIAVVECKLAANAEIKRKVIGQILEYGACLWGMAYEQLDDRVQQRTDKTLTDLVGEAAGEPEWDQEAFRSSITRTLREGSFILVIAVDDINEELSRTIRFLNGCGEPAFAFTALEMRRFQRDETEILVPRVFGVERPESEDPEGRREQWTEEEYFAAIATLLPEDTSETIGDLYNWSKERADRIWFGTGKERGSFTFHYLVNGNTASVFSVYTTGTLTLNYGWLTNQMDPKIMGSFHSAVTSIPGFHTIPEDFNRWPSVKISEVFLNNPGALGKFKQAVEELGDKIR